MSKFPASDIKVVRHDHSHTVESRRYVHLGTLRENVAPGKTHVHENEKLIHTIHI